MLTTHAERVQTTQVEELLSNMNWARGELEALIASTPPELMIGPRKDGWSAKDHLYHLATWDLYLIAVLEREPRLPAIGVDADPSAPFDDVNAIFFARGKDLPLRQVLSMFRGNRSHIMELVRGLRDEDLDRPVSESQPAIPPPPAGDVRRWIEAITFEHDREHGEWMRELPTEARAEIAVKTPHLQPLSQF